MNIAPDGVQKLVLIKTIGKGSFGNVWLAKYGNVDVAAKEMGQKIKKGEEKEYKKEMEIMLQLNNPHIVRLYGSIATDNSFFILMEYVPLGSLKSAIDKYTFSAYMRCRLMMDVANGMEYLHSQGIIHRDLKPENVLVASLDPNADVLCKINDFGISRQSSAETKTSVMTRGVGTPYYMAPEMLRGDEKYSRTVDMYSFGIMCAELWNEEPPYNEVHFDSLVAFVLIVIDGKRPLIHNDCPTPLVELITRCWATNGSERPPFASIVKDLGSIVKDVGQCIPSNVEHVKLCEKKRASNDVNEINEWSKPKSNGGVAEPISFDSVMLDDFSSNVY